jgi:hypothetical protein
MAGMVTCLRCGAQSIAGTPVCATCGVPLAPIGVAAGAALPGPASMAPAQAAAIRPTGITALAVVECAIAVVGLFIARDLLYWIDWRFSYDETGGALIDMALFVAYIGTSFIGFTVVKGMWLLQPWVWRRAVTLTLVQIGLIVFSVLLWGMTSLDIVGLVVNAAVLGFLVVSPSRVLLGGPAMVPAAGQG